MDPLCVRPAADPRGAPAHLIYPTGATTHMTSSIEATSSANATPATHRVTVDDLGSEEAFLTAIDETITHFNDGDIDQGTAVKVDRHDGLLATRYKTEPAVPRPPVP